jgi:hypothetical protein
MSRFRAQSVGESLARGQTEPAAPTGPIVTHLRGEDVISQGLLNKGSRSVWRSTALSHEGRDDPIVRLRLLP